MPRKSRKMTRRRKKQYDIKGPYRLLNRGPSVVPDIYSTKMHFGQVNSNVAATLSQTYRANSLYDPDYTGVGVQPKGFDQLAALYGSYRVRACKLEVDAFNNKNTPLIVGIYASMDPAITVNADDLICEPYVKHKVLAPVGSGTANAKMSLYMSTSRLTGDKVTDDQYESAISTNPATPWYWHVVGLDATGSSVNVQYSAKLTFYVDFFDRLDLEMS